MINYSTVLHDLSILLIQKSNIIYNLMNNNMLTIIEFAEKSPVLNKWRFIVSKLYAYKMGNCNLQGYFS